MPKKKEIKTIIPKVENPEFKVGILVKIQKNNVPELQNLGICEIVEPSVKGDFVLQTMDKLNKVLVNEYFLYIDNECLEKQPIDNNQFKLKDIINRFEIQIQCSNGYAKSHRTEADILTGMQTTWEIQNNHFTNLVNELKQTLGIKNGE